MLHSNVLDLDDLSFCDLPSWSTSGESELRAIYVDSSWMVLIFLPWPFICWKNGDDNDEEHGDDDDEEDGDDDVDLPLALGRQQPQLLLVLESESCKLLVLFRLQSFIAVPSSCNPFYTRPRSLYICIFSAAFKTHKKWPLWPKKLT